MHIGLCFGVLGTAAGMIESDPPYAYLTNEGRCSVIEPGLLAAVRGRRARNKRTSAQTGSRDGSRNRPIQTAEGEITVAMQQQVLGTVERFVGRTSQMCAASSARDRSKALVISAHVRGLSDCDIEACWMKTPVQELTRPQRRERA